MFIRFQHLRVTPSFNLLEEFYTCFQSSFYDDNFCKNKLCFAVNSGQSIFPMIFDFGIFFIDVDTPLNLRSTKFLFVFFKRWEYLTIHFRIAHRVTWILSCCLRCSFTFLSDAPSPYSCRARTICSGFILILLNPSSCTYHLPQAWQKNFCFEPESLCLNPFFTTLFEPHSSQTYIAITSQKLWNLPIYKDDV